MVSHINFAVDDELAERARTIKDSNDWSWPDLLEHAIEEFEDGE